MVIPFPPAAFTAGSSVTFQVAATATHLGRFEFRVCTFGGHEATSLTQECLDAHVLQPAPGESHRVEFRLCGSTTESVSIFLSSPL